MEDHKSPSKFSKLQTLKSHKRTKREKEKCVNLVQKLMNKRGGAFNSPQPESKNPFNATLASMSLVKASGYVYFFDLTTIDLMCFLRNQNVGRRKILTQPEIKHLCRYEIVFNFLRVK